MKTDGIIRGRDGKLYAFRFVQSEKANFAAPIPAFYTQYPDSRLYETAYAPVSQGLPPEIRKAFGEDDRAGIVGFSKYTETRTPNPGINYISGLLRDKPERFRIAPKAGLLVYSEAAKGKVFSRTWQITDIRVVEEGRNYRKIDKRPDFERRTDLCKNQAKRESAQVAQMRRVIETELEEPLRKPLVVELHAEPKPRPNCAIPKMRKTKGWGQHRVFDPKA